jgi:ketosteroid isomerase-like protein
MTERDEELLKRARILYEGEARELQVLSPDIVWHVPGHNPVSGVYRGADYFQVMPARMAPLDRWDFQLETVMVNGDHVVARFHVVGKRKGRVIDTDGTHLLRFDANNQIVEGWGFTDKQDELDTFFGA